jgi:hypothetical protein
MEKKNVIKWLRSMTFRGYNLGDLVPIVIAFTLIAIIGGVVLLILNGFASSPSIGNTCYAANVLVNGVCNAGPTYYSSAYNGVTYGVSGINQIMQFLPLIALVVVAAVIIGVVVGAFVLGGRTKEGF